MSRELNASYEELVDKAKMIFWNDGYKSVSHDVLAERLGVSTSTVYNKFGKERLFIDGLNAYVQGVSDPALKMMRDSEEGLEAFRTLFYSLIDALYDGLFPRNCLMVNTVLEFRDEVEEINEIYDTYFANLRQSYTQKLERAFDLGEIESKSKIPAYVELFFGAIFALSVLQKVKTPEELKTFFDIQLSLVK